MSINQYCVYEQFECGSNILLLLSLCFSIYMYIIYIHRIVDCRTDSMIFDDSFDVGTTGCSSNRAIIDSFNNSRNDDRLRTEDYANPFSQA